MEQEEEFYIIESTDSNIDGIGMFSMIVLFLFIGCCILTKWFFTFTAI